MSLARQEALEASPSTSRGLSDIAEEAPLASTSALLPVQPVEDVFGLNFPELETVQEADELVAGEDVAEEDAETYVVPLPDEEEENAVEATPRRATIRKRASTRLSGSGSFVNGGWRNWRAAGSQPATPSGEVPPLLSYSVQPPSAGPLATEPGDYFGTAMTSRLNSIAEASPSPRSSAMLKVESQERAMSTLPKLSPEFSFGRRTPSPAPPSEPDQGSALLEEERAISPCASRKVRESIVPLPAKLPQQQRRNRAASADHLGPAFPKPAAAVNPVPAAKQTSSSSVSHRNRLAMRKFAGNAPRFQARSFDAEELKLLREMTAPKYSWI